MSIYVPGIYMYIHVLTCIYTYLVYVHTYIHV